MLFVFSAWPCRLSWKNTKRSYQRFFWCHWFWTFPCLFPWWVPHKWVFVSIPVLCWLLLLSLLYINTLDFYINLVYRLSTTVCIHQFSVSYSGRSPRNLPICDFSSPPSTLSFRSVASHSLPSSSALLVRPCNRARCCDIQEDASGKDDGCELASLPCCCRCGSSGYNYYTLFSSVWHFGRSAPVVGTFVWMDGLSSVDVLADVFVDVCFVEFYFLFLDVHFYI